MNKKLVSLVLSGLIVLNNTGSLENVYADNNNKPKELIKNEDTKSAKVVYLEDGEGDLGQGDGTANKPYKNIRTALSKINNGDTLKIKGDVRYTKFKQDANGAALPLEIDKAITIEGEAGAVFTLRAPIQLKADVTFKDLNLELVPEISLGKDVSKSNDRMLGTVIERSATIYVNGNRLTLDNINTKVGTNLDQSKYRPYISGGSHKSSNAPTGKSVINIINSNEETKFSGIYAGDYNKEATLDVEINIDGEAKVEDNKIYTGGYNHNLNGDVNINLSGNNSITKFDKANHNGNINVNLQKNAFVYNFDATNINDLTLEENSKIILSNSGNFEVDNVVLQNDATIDFRDMTQRNPIVKGNFEGEDTIDTLRKGGTIFLNNNQTLDIKGILSGTTRLNNRGIEPVHSFLDNHVYVKTGLNSKGIFTIEDSIFDNYKLNSNEKDSYIEWRTTRIAEGFGDFKWASEDSRIVPSDADTESAEGVFKVEFINDEGQIYTPDVDDLYTDFEYTLTKLDKDGNEDEVIHIDEESDSGIDKDNNVEFYLSGDGIDTDIVVWLNNVNNLKNDKMILKVTHKKTQKSIEKNIYIVKHDKQLSGNVNIVGSPIEGRIISVDISGLPKDVEDVKYKWYVVDQSGKAELIKDQTGKDFVLKPEYVGSKIKVEVEAMNYLDKVSSNEVVVKPKDAAPVIEGIDQIEIKAGDVDKFNNGENLKGITAKDCNNNPIDKINVIGTVEKPEAGSNKTFEIKYSVTDNDGITTEEIRKVTVTNQKPTISGLSEITITQGETTDIKIGVTANDYEDGTITKIVYPTDDLTKLGVGTHKIVYSVTDSDGNIVQSERKVVILEKIEEKPELPDIEGSTPDVEEKPELPDTEGSKPDVEEKPELPDTEENTPDVEEKPELPDTEGSKPDVEEKPELPDTEESTPEDTLKPEQGIVEDISKIEGIEIESGNGTIESPISVKVDTLSGIADLLNYYTSNNFNVDSVEAPKEEGNFLIYLLKITKNTIARIEESYFMEVKVDKENKEIIEQLETIIDKDNTSNENDTTVEDQSNNNSSNNKPNNNNDINNNNSENNSNEFNKEESPKTYDGGIGSYILSGIGSIGLLSILNKKKKRKK